MIKEAKKRIIATVVLLAVLLSSLIAASVAWLADYLEPSSNGEFAASAMVSYFAGGSGKKDDPYLITSARHLYNLSWLQNKGDVFTEKNYFKLADKNGNPVDIDVKGELTSGDSKVYHYAPTPLTIQDISLSRESVSSPTDEPFGQRITEKTPLNNKPDNIE